MAVDFALRGSDISVERGIMIFSIYFGHYDFNIPIKQLSSLVSKDLPNQIVCMYYVSQFSLVATNDKHSSLSILVILATGLINF
jgi:hypothetical protein